MKQMEEDTIDLLELARAVWKNILIIALVAAITGTAVFAFTAVTASPEYKATASLYVNNSSFELSSANLGATNISVSGGELSTSKSLIPVYIYILNSRTTVEEIIKEADLSYTPEELLKKEMFEAKEVSSTGVFEVTVTSSDPAEAELIANTIARILPDRIAEIVDGSSARVVDYAVMPAQRTGSNLTKNTAIGVLAGAFLSIAVVVVLFLLKDPSEAVIRSAEELREIYPDVMVLAMIPDMREPEGKKCCFSCRSDRKNGKKEETGNA